MVEKFLNIHNVVDSTNFDKIIFVFQKFPDLRFKYVEEEQPEDFFVPYTWTLVRNKMYWNVDEIILKNALFLDQ